MTLFETASGEESLEDDWFRVLAETTSAAIVVFRDQRFLYVNSAAEELTGHAAEELLALPDLWQLVAPEQREPTRRRGASWLAGEDLPRGTELQLLQRGGGARWVELSANRVRWRGEPAVIATLIDISRHRRVERELSREKELAQVTLESIGEGVLRTDDAGRVDYLNPAAERITGWTLEEARGREVTEVYQVIHESTRAVRRNPVETCLDERRAIALPGLFVLLGRAGEEYTIRDSVAPILGPEGEISGAVLAFRDLTHVRGLERQMVYLASHDTLTGLLNRQELEIYLEAALENARDREAEHALLYLDLWEFKLVNDCYGHVAGDELLRRVAELLKSEVGERGILGRVGDDDFALLLEDRSPSEARDFARDLRHAFRDVRFNWGGQSFEVGVSIGLVPITPASESVAQILKAADAACHLARQSGRNQIHVYVQDDAAVAERHGRLHWVRRIRRCLAEDRFCLYYQEIRPLAGGGGLVEILVRMIDDDGSHLSPGTFIPVAENHDLAPSLDRWVLRQTLARMSQGTNGPLHAAPVTINLSGQSLGDGTFLEDLVDLVQGSGVEPRRLSFEITETAAVANLSRALRFIETLKEMGCRFILDDFGSGLSSFGYLKNLPVDIVKIDGQFVRSMETDPIRRAMVSAINQIGQVMGLQTIAEWVETEATYDMLRDLGVDFVQGFLIHKPEPLR